MSVKQFIHKLRSKRILQLALSLLLVPGILIAIYGVVSFIQNSDRNFSRGVLALNIDQSVYLPGDPVLLQMASLDNNGDTLCDSNLEVTIDVPSKWRDETIRRDQIQRSPTCDPTNNVTNEPDYIARFLPQAKGTYRLKLRNLDTGKSVESQLLVDDTEQAIMLSRSGATRINPAQSDRYPMILRVTANQDFKGTLVESVPKVFQFKWYGPAQVAQSEETQTLTWEVELKSGETKEFAYEYTAPPISPEFYKLGLLKLVDEAGNQIFQEQSHWQIAADAVDSNANFVYGNYSGTVDNLNFRTYTQAGGAGGQLTTVDTSDTNGVKWTKIVASPTRDEKIAAQMNATGILKILKCTGGCDATGDWSEIGSYSALATAANALLHRPYDIAYEQLSGMFTIVFAVTTDVDDVYYCQYDGSTWSPATVCGSTFAPGAGNQIDMAGVGVAGQPEWIRLVSKGSRLTSTRSDELMLGVSDSADDLFLAHWNGSAWEDQNNPNDDLSATNAQKFDIAFEETSTPNPSEALAVVTNTAVANLRYVTYTSGAWNGIASSGEANSAEAFSSWINMDADPITDDIAIIINDSGNDAELFHWDGSTLQDFDATDDTSAEAVTGGHSQVAWSRFTSQAVYMWTDTNVLTSDMECWQTGGGNFTAVIADVGATNISNADDIDDATITSSPNNDRLLMTRRGSELVSGTGDDLVGMMYDGAGCADGDWTTLGTLLAGGGTAGLEGGTIGNSVPKSHASAYTPYSPWSLNWRFFDDETADNPSTGLNGAAENVAPADVDAEEFIRLRMNMAERGGMTQGDTRKILQYAVGSGSCTPNSVESDPDCTWTNVGDTSETSAVWRYATAGETCTGCADGSTSNTPSLTSTTTGDPEVFYVSDKDAAQDADFDHAGLTVKEVDFPLKAEAVTGGATYYFRMYEPRISSVGQDSVVFREQDADGSDDCAGGVCTYPSLSINLPVITVSGVIRQTNESSAYDCSAVTAVTVRTATNGGANQSADCTASDGTYSITTAADPGAANIPVVVFIDTGEGIKGTTVTLSSAGATNITGLDIIVDRLTVTQESATAITNTHLATADNADAGIRYAVSGGNLTVESPMELHVRTTETFAPGGNVTTDKMHVVGTYTGNGGTLTLLGSGTSTARPLYVNGGTFTASATTIFQGTSATDIEATTFNALSLTPTITGAVTYTLLGAETINGNFIINPTAGTTQLLTVNAGGTITVGAAYTTTVSGTTSGTSSLDLRPGGTDYNLSTGKLDIATAGTLDAGSTTASTITLTAATSTLFTRSGNFTAGGSTVIFNPDAAVTLTSGTFTGGNAFNNLSLTPAISSAGRTYTFGAGAIEMGGDFLIQPSGTQLLTVAMAGNITVAATKSTTISRTSTATSTLNTNGSNPALSSGSIVVATGGTLNGTGSTSTISLTATSGTPFSLSGDNYTEGTTTIAYAPASGTALTVTSTTYNNVIFNRSGMTFSLATSGITVTNDLTITAGVLDAVSGSNFPITVGRNWTNTPGTGGFLAQNGTVTFNTTTAAAITGATIFYNFSATTAPKAIDFGDATTFQINGLLTLTGSAGPNYITLDSVTGGSTQWTINHQGTESISYASVKNSACDGASTIISADNGTNYNAGNNGTCWLFTAAAVNASVWKLDEGYGTTANDTSANNASGTLAGASLPTWQSEDMCISGKCLYFEGTAAKVTVASPVNTKTVSLWVRPTSNTMTILQLTATKYISATSGTLAASGFTGTFYVNGVQTTTLQANRWQHVVVTTGTSISADAIILGNNSTSYFKGFMDEVKLISTEYSAAQVKAEFTKRGSVDGVSAQFGDAHTGQVLSDGLVGYWKMDETSGDAADSSGNSGALTNNGTTTYVAGKFGRGSEHVPASSQHFSITGTPVANTYYLNASDAGPTDAGSAWTNDANAFDGSTSTYAEVVTTANALTGQGSNAPTSGDPISQVRGRAYGCAGGTTPVGNASFYYSAVSLGVANYPVTAATCVSGFGWSSYTTLSTPSGGWTWQKVNDLEVRSSLSIGTRVRAYRAEVEVTSAPGASIPALSTVSFWTNPDALTNYYINLSSSANIQTNSSGVIAANGFTNPKIYVNGVEGSTLVANQWQHVVVTSDTAVTVDEFYIGRVGASNYYDGTLDEVRLYNRNLTPAEVEMVRAYAPGPIGHWKLDENTGTAAYDISGNLNNGTLTDGPTWSPGQFGQAVRFDGTDDYVTIPDSPSLVFGNGTTDMAMSVSAWIKQDDTSQFNATGFVIASKTNDTLPSLEWLFDVFDNQIGISLYDNVGNSRITRYATTAYPFAANTWYHISATYDGTGTGGIKLFINGAEVPTTLETDYIGGTYVSMHDTTGGVHIGAFAPADGTYQMFGKGYVDDFRIYNYKRTAEQVIVDMNGGHPIGGSPVGSATSYWKFDEATESTAYDHSSNANNLTLSASSWNVDGKYGAAWNGTGSVWLSHADDADFDLESDSSFSISLWFRSDNATNPGADQFLFDKQVNGNNAGYRLYVSTSGLLVCDVDDDTSSYPEDSVTTTIDYYDATWHHVVCMRDSGNTDLLLYVDGQLLSSDTTLSATGSLANTELLYVGDDDGDAANSFAGDIDEVRFYRAALSASQVKTEFNANKAMVLGNTGTTSTGSRDNSQLRGYCVPGDSSTCGAPVAEYHFEVLGNDSSGNGNNYELTPTDQVIGVVGKAADFEEASGDVLRVDDNNTFDIGGSFSISTWINPETLPASGTVRTITGKTGDGDSEAAGTQTNWFFVLDNNIGGAGYGLVCSFEDSAHADHVIGAPRVAVSTGVWTHVACVFDDANNQGRIYVNGQLISTTTVTATPATNNYHFYLGISNQINQFSIENEFDGIMDEFRLYNYARSSSQIAWDMNNGAPIAWYRFDECTGTTINDASGNGYSGTLTVGPSSTNTSAGTCSSGNGAHAWNNGTTGYINSSIYIDGYDDYTEVVANGGAILSSGDTFSASMWVNWEGNDGGNQWLLYNGDRETNGWHLSINNADNNELQITCENTDTITTNTSLPIGTWHHVVVVNDGDWYLYLDGKPVQLAGGTSCYPGTATQHTVIGAIDTNVGASTPFMGQIDDVRFFNYPLTRQQLRDVYNGGAVQFN